MPFFFKELLSESSVEGNECGLAEGEGGFCSCVTLAWLQGPHKFCL